MMEVSINQAMRNSADIKANALGTLDRSMLKGKGNFVGFLGEEIVLAFDGFETANTFDYDILLDNDIKIDVKTKLCRAKPDRGYEASIATYYDQKCDIYVFTRIERTYNTGWICGYMNANDYHDKSHFVKKGTIDSTNGMMFKADSHNLAYYHLNSFGDLL